MHNLMFAYAMAFISLAAVFGFVPVARTVYTCIKRDGNFSEFGWRLSFAFDDYMDFVCGINSPIIAFTWGLADLAWRALILIYAYTAFLTNFPGGPTTQCLTQKQAFAVLQIALLVWVAFYSRWHSCKAGR